MGLGRYRKKRDFGKTPEPKGGGAKRGKKLRFVVQKHDARRLHYDFRLEWQGALKSWAVPKGPSLDPGEKRLAVEVEDHPLEYASFEGTIPKGEYGAGTVALWDEGSWEPLGEVSEGLKKGRLEFSLQGKKLKGQWKLVRMGREKNWLLIKGKDSFARAGADLLGEGRPEPPPAFVEPELAELVEAPPEGPEWVHEIKFDGYRTLARIDGERVQLLTRSGHDWTHRYGPLRDAFQALPTGSALIDGEVVWVSGNGLETDFQGLQSALKNKDFSRLAFYAFDLLFLNGEDLRDLPLVERKRRLEALLQGQEQGRLFFSRHWESDIYPMACKMGLEGVVSKHADEPYLSGRSSSWQKIRCSLRQEFVVGGYAESEKGRPFAALLLGVFAEGRLRYVGRTGTGFSEESLRMLGKKLKGLRQGKTPFKDPPAGTDLRWVKPVLVAEVEFKAWTKNGLLRMASFQGLREDKPAAEVRAEKPEEGNRVGGITISHPDRLVYPKAKVKKIEIARYYEALSERMMPFLEDRPLSLLRCPKVAGKDCFFQKHAAMQGMVARPVAYGEKSDTALTVGSTRDLLRLVQNGALEFHGWGSRFSEVGKPDRLVFDLDPSSPKLWPRVVETAQEIRQMLEQLGLVPYLKVTGGKGLHVEAPIEPRYGWDLVKSFCRSLMQVLVRAEPKLYTVSLSKEARRGKIFLDYLRNGYGATAVLPYSLRSQARPTVALPLAWEELSASLRPDQFEMGEALERRDPWKGYWQKARRIGVLEQAGAA